MRKCSTFNNSLFNRWCWSRPSTWPSQSTAAAACWPPLLPAHCQLKPPAGGSRNPASEAGSGARRWWAEPPLPARRESLSPARARRADEMSTQGLQNWQHSLHAVRIISSRTAVASKSHAARYLMSCRVWTPLLSHFCHWVKCMWIWGEGL